MAKMLGDALKVNKKPFSGSAGMVAEAWRAALLRHANTLCESHASNSSRKSQLAKIVVRHVKR